MAQYSHTVGAERDRVGRGRGPDRSLGRLGLRATEALSHCRSPHSVAGVNSHLGTIGACRPRCLLLMVRR